MGYGGMPRKKKDDIDWDNLDAAAEDKPKEEAKGKAKKGKKGKGDDSDDDTPASAAPAAEAAGMAMSKTALKAAKRAAKKGGGGKGDDSDDDAPAPAPAAAAQGKKGKGKPAKTVDEDEEEESEEEAPAPKAKDMKKGAAAIAALPAEGEEEEDEDDSSDEGPRFGADKVKGGKKEDRRAKGKGKMGKALQQLGSSDEGESLPGAGPESPVPAGKGGGGGKGKAIPSFAAFAAANGGDDDDEEEEEDETAKPVGKKDKKKDKKGKKKEDSGEEEKDSEDDFVATSSTSKAKKVAPPPKKAAASFAALMGDEEGEEKEDDDEEEEAPVKASPKEEKKEKKEKDKKEKKEERKSEEMKLPELSVEEKKILKELLKSCVFQGVVVGVIKKCDKHPKADNLMVLEVSDGGFGSAQVVTNAKNVEVGLKVAFAPVGAEVFDEELGSGTTTVKAVKLKGINSAGMLCSEKLLGLGAEDGVAMVFPGNCPLGLDVGEAYFRIMQPQAFAEKKAKMEEDRKKMEEEAAKKAEANAAKKAAQAAKKAAEPAVEKDESKAAAPKKGQKVNAQLALLQEQQRLVRERQEEMERIEREQKEAEEAALRAIEQQEAEAARKREEKKAKKKEKEEQLRKEGKLLSKKQKEQQAKNEEARKQFEKLGMVAAPTKEAKEDAADSSSDDEEEGKDKAAAPGQPKKLTKNDIKQMEKERKERQKAAAEERAKRLKELEEAKAEAERLAKEMEGVADNWDDGEENDTAAAQAQEEEEEEAETSGSDYDSDDNKLSKTAKRARKQRKLAEVRRLKKMEANLKNKSKDNLRCPVICVLGHVDTGKTKILDKIRRTNVQEGEAGGITQQIGASYFPIEAITEKTLPVLDMMQAAYEVPGLLIIDTPGHESFTNLRTRGSSLCDLAVLVVDIMHGLEPQTIESIGLLKKRKAPFVIALNKIDRLYGWVSHPEQPVQKTLEMQSDSVKGEFDMRYRMVQGQLAEQGLNACVFYENEDMKTFLNMVPTSAISGDGMMDLLYLLCDLPAKMLVDKIMFHENLECTVLEVKAIEGLGTTMDVIVVNGRIREKDTIVVCGLDGPIVTQIRSLLTPQPMKEMRVKTPYVHHSEIKGAIGVKISATGIERALAGSNLYVVGPDDDIEELKSEVMKDLGGILKRVRKNEDGVYVQASTLGSLEALLEFLDKPGKDRDGNDNPSIPVSGIGIGPVSKYDVMRCSVMLERDKEWVKMCEKEYAATGEWISGNPMNSFKEAYACILAFDVPVLKDAEIMAKETGIPIYTAEIIYHLFDAFTKRIAEIRARKKEEAKKKALYPCVFKIVSEQTVFNKKDPYILGIDVVEGTLKLGLPVIIPDCKWTGDAKTQTAAGEKLSFGNVMSIEKDKKPIESATRLTGSVAIRIEQKRNMKEYTFGRHWDHEALFVSALNRESIDLLKEHFRDEVPKEDWKTVVKIKKLLAIP